MGRNIPNMGRDNCKEAFKTGSSQPVRRHNELPSLGLAEGLFSRVQMRVLALLFGQPERGFQGAELIRLAGSGVGAVHRELTRLVSSGIVSVQPLGRQKIYSANRESRIFQELHGLIMKTVGLSQPLRDALEPFAHRIKYAFIYGSTARGDDTSASDVDLMIIGDELAYPEVLAALLPVEQAIGRTVSVNLLNCDEFGRRLLSRDSFLARVMSQEKLTLLGSLDGIETAR
jgi:predicted nucleotidyltransferase